MFTELIEEEKDINRKKAQSQVTYNNLTTFKKKIS